MILVVGSTGILGTAICKRLRGKGAAVRGLVRTGSPKEAQLKDMGVEIAYGDLKDPGSIAQACEGVTCVVSTANSMMSRRKGDTFKTVDHDGQLGLVEAAKKAGVGHFVLVSVAPASPDCEFIRAKRVVEKAIRDSGMTWTILQPSGFMEIMFSPMAGWDPVKGKARVVGAGDVPHSAISLYDVAEFTVMATEREDMRGRVLPLGGPASITSMDAVKAFEKATGKEFKVDRAPAPILKIMSAVLRPFNQPLSTVLTFASSHEAENIDMTTVVSEFPVKLTSLEEVVQRAVSGSNPPAS